MKIPKEIAAEMLSAMQETINKNKELWKEHAEKHGLDSKRFRWDVFWNSKIREMRSSTFVCDFVYKDNGVKTGVNDDHIDTVLRKFSPKF